MINRVKISEIKEHSGKEIQIAGFVQALRDQNKIVFLNIRDVSGITQVVSISGSEGFEIAKKVSLESVVLIKGLVKESAQAPGGFEIEAYTVDVLSPSNPHLPIPVVTEKSGGETEQSTRLDNRFIDLRKQDKTLIFKVWTELEKGFRKYWSENDYLQIYTPAFMNSASETGADVFEVKYFETKAYLAQSPQFYKQMAMASGFERVFMTGPVFRAEKSFTPRHMTEFTGWDFEISYIESHADLMDQEEGMIVEGFKQVAEALPEIGLVIPARPFPRLTMTEAKEKLSKKGIPSEKDHDISPEEEKVLSEIVKEEFNHDFVFITDFHKSMRPFYHMRHEDNGDLTKSADLLYRGIEITTLAQREHRPDVLEAQAIEKGMNLEELADYLSFFKYGCPPHGGAGLGPNRIVMKMLDLANVREATYLPRDVNRLTP